MRQKNRGLNSGLTQYGDIEFARYLRRSFAKSMGYSDRSLNKPIVGICMTQSGFNNCHQHFPALVEAINRGVLANGALPVSFPMISLGEVFLSPTSMAYRNLMAMAVEEMIRAQPMDAVVLMGGCDKTVPALLMGAISAAKPAVLLVAGPMITARHKGERLGACTDCRRFWAQYRGGAIDEKEINQVENQLAVTAGTCPVMGTASSMALIGEVLGMMPSGSASIPAVHADRLRAAEETGSLAAAMAASGKYLPDQIITRQAIDNAVRVLLAVSGSTNAIIHLTAIAGRLGINLTLERLNELSEQTPVLVDLKPVGRGYMEDFHYAGGLNEVLHSLRNELDLTCRDITGQTLAARLKKYHPVDQDIICSTDRPISPKGGLIALYGSLAPEGAVLKRAAASPHLLEHQGRAVVFNSLEDLAKRVDDPDLDIQAEDIMVLQNAGPRSPAAMPEAGYLPIPKKLASQGITDMVRISDARMSGTAFGTIVLHTCPEAALGGPLALVQTGDLIRLSAKNKTLDLLISDDELSRRKRLRQVQTSSPDRGYRQLYHRSVLPATKGCDFDFLVGSQ